MTYLYFHTVCLINIIINVHGISDSFIIPVNRTVDSSLLTTSAKKWKIGDLVMVKLFNNYTKIIDEYVAVIVKHLNNNNYLVKLSINKLSIFNDDKASKRLHVFEGTVHENEIYKLKTIVDDVNKITINNSKQYLLTSRYFIFLKECLKVMSYDNNNIINIKLMGGLIYRTFGVDGLKENYNKINDIIIKIFNDISIKYYGNKIINKNTVLTHSSNYCDSRLKSNDYYK